MYRFGAFTLDPERGELAKNERPVRLQPQPTKLLVLLVERAGHVVTRDEIQEALWDGETFVDFDQSINFCVKRIRDVLGDHAAEPRYLETVPRSGYRFVADVRTVADDAFRPRTSGRLGKAAVLLPFAALVAFLAFWGGWRDRESPIRRFVIPLDNPGYGFDLSPDGKTVVYTARGRGGGSVLHRRPVDGFTSTAVERAEGWGPFFSPDGSWVAYLHSDALWKVPLTGGAPILVSDSVDFGSRGSTWVEDGTIVHNGGLLGPLYQVPSAGGSAELFTRLDVEAGDLAHLWPHALPGGEWVLFTSLWEHGGVVVAQSLRTGERREVLRGGTSARYASSGHLVFARSDTLFAVPFDPVSLAVWGEPVPVLEGVEYREYDGMSLFRVAPNGTLAYVPAAPRPRQWLSWYDRDGTSERLDLPSLNVRLSPGITLITPRISRDGRKLAVSIREKDASAAVWLYDLERKSETRFTDEWWSAFLEWSPSGESLAYLTIGPGGFRTVVRDASPPGSATTVYRSAAFHWPVSWLAGDRGLLLQEMHRESTGLDVMLLEPLVEDATPSAVLGSIAHEENGKISPDGQLLAYTLNEPPGRNVYVCTFPALEDRTLVSPDGGDEPLWSPDGKELFFKSVTDEQVMVVDVTSHPELRLSTPRTLFTGRFAHVDGGATNYDVTPDGERLLMVVEEELPETTPQIHVVLDWLRELERKVALARR